MILRPRGVANSQRGWREMLAALCGQPRLNYHSPIVEFFPEIT